MVTRLLKLPKSNSFFLFGPRGVGKSTLLREHYKNESCLWLDLLNEDEYEKYLLHPQLLKDVITAEIERNKINVVVIDEVQKIPKLLNIVHQVIESKHKIQFALTGSSSRRLKQKGVNLLAGRAWVENMHPLTYQELGNNFDLIPFLAWGGLPKLLDYKSSEEKASYLKAYVQTYVRTEVQQEQWVRKIEPFRHFLPIAAQMNGQPINASNIAKDVGVDVTTIQNYYEILEDTLLGFFLPAFHHSVRKQQRQAPKFYFFDTGVQRCLENKLSLPLQTGTSDFGNSFEHFLVCEIRKIISYKKLDFNLSYLRTRDDVEIDLIVERPGRTKALIEVKSKSKVDDRDVSSLNRISKDIKNSESYLLSLDQQAKKLGETWALYWKDGLKQILDSKISHKT